MVDSLNFKELLSGFKLLLETVIGSLTDSKKKS